MMMMITLLSRFQLQNAALVWQKERAKKVIFCLATHLTCTAHSHSDCCSTPHCMQILKFSGGTVRSCVCQPVFPTTRWEGCRRLAPLGSQRTMGLRLFLMPSAYPPERKHSQLTKWKYNLQGMTKSDNFRVASSCTRLCQLHVIKEAW